jgi:hypothetical protein
MLIESGNKYLRVGDWWVEPLRTGILKNGEGTLASGTLSLSAIKADGVNPPATRPECRRRYRAGS